VAALRNALEGAGSGPVELRVNDNTSSLITVRPGSAADQPPLLSVHRMFLTGEPPVIRALAQYLRRPTAASTRILRLFMNARLAEVRDEPVHPRRVVLRSRGAVHDLHRLAAEVNATHFGDALKVRITWSQGRLPGAGKRRRHIVFGSYDHKTRVIRIHPALDTADTPEFFLRFVIFHEMLHAVLEPEHDADGRRTLHSRDFRHRERQHPDYERSMAWERDFMRRL
jgi:hypothetical protein